MTIPAETWARFSKRLSKINSEAAAKVQKWVEQNGLDDMDALIDYAFAIATRYGEAAGALSAELYDAIAELSRADVDPAEIAATPSYATIRKTIYGTMKTSVAPSVIGAAIGRQVKKCGTDTTLKNAARDRAEYAWIAVGETCPFCLAIAAEGWKRASAKWRSQEHLHGNCDCTYTVRFNKDTRIAGYDPSKYQRMIDSAEGDTLEEKLNSMRREAYAENREEILEQKHSAAAIRAALNGPDAEEIEI